MLSKRRITGARRAVTACLGIGLADFTTQRFLKQYDPTATYVNLLTATRILRKGFETHFVMFGPGSLAAAATSNGCSLP